MNIEPTPVRDVAMSFTAHSGYGALVNGTIWFKVQGPVNREVIEKGVAAFVQFAADKRVGLTAEDVMLVNVFTSEI